MTDQTRQTSTNPALTVDHLRTFVQVAKATSVITPLLGVAVVWFLDLPVADLHRARFLLTVTAVAIALTGLYFFQFLARRNLSLRLFQRATVVLGILTVLSVAVSGGSMSPFFAVLYVFLLASTWVVRSTTITIASGIGIAVLLWLAAHFLPAYNTLTETYFFLQPRWYFEFPVMVFVAMLITGSNASRERSLLDLTASLAASRETLAKQKRIIEHERDTDRALLASIGDGVFAIDRQGRVILFNQAAERMTGIPLPDALGQEYHRLLQFVDDKTGTPVHDTIASVSVDSMRTSLRTGTTLRVANGRTMPVAVSISPITAAGSGPIGVIVVFRDVTDERRADRIKSEFISIASHQLRTPLSTVKWFLELVMRGMRGKLPSKEDDFLRQAYGANERLIRLVNDLLNVSRIESGRLAVHTVPTDLGALLGDAIESVRPLIQAKRLHLAYERKTARAGSVPLDPQLVTMVVQNLLTNAIKYTPEGGAITVRLERRPSATSSGPNGGDDARVDVTDTGYGIPTHEQRRVFERFYRGENVQLHETEGTGFGLYIARAITELCGGTMGFTSTENKGSTFWFTLPLTRSAAKPQSEVRLARRAKATPLSSTNTQIPT
ncbi:MAG: PAS domain-containing protein [Candidatus Kerfeldbacteria bacterium]|nr:PAS domain-containing protein [Candidatus Kerfeldbacteria bacterium]